MPIGIASICNAAARPSRMDCTDPISVIQWTSGAESMVNLTLRRKAAVTRGSVPPAAPAPWDVAAEWEALAIDSFDGLGSR